MEKRDRYQLAEPTFCLSALKGNITRQEQHVHISEERNKQLAVIEPAEKDWIRPVGVIYRSK